MISEIGKGLTDTIEGLALMFLVMAVITVPLAIWKLVDIAMWCFHHINISACFN